MNRHRMLFVVVVIWLLPALACGIGGGGREEPTAAAAQPTSAPAVATQAPPEATSTPQQEPAPAASPTVAQPTATGPAPTSAAGAGTGVERQWASAATASSEYSSPEWSAQQATGAPDTPQCGDFNTAWASQSASGLDWLEVSFAKPLIPDTIEIYETHAPGSIMEVEVIDGNGVAYGVWQGQPRAVDTCPRVFRVPVTGISVPIARVRITLDQSVVQDWGEIDAVQLIGRPASGAAAATAPTSPAAGGAAISQWAVEAAASSEYSSPEWSAQQATGAPDTPACGDSETAWASLGASERAWLEAGFATPVRPTEIVIYETHAPGSIAKVEVLDAAGAARTVWEGTPEAVATCPRAFRVPVSGVNTLVTRVRITLDQTIIQDWNEIDAIQLVGVPQ